MNLYPDLQGFQFCQTKHTVNIRLVVDALINIEVQFSSSEGPARWIRKFVGLRLGVVESAPESSDKDLWLAL